MPPRMRQRGAEAQEQPCAGQRIVGRGAGVELESGFKGLDGREFCEFGSGAVDLTPVLGSLVEGGYRGMFTVEYEGPFDKTLRLYQSVHRAEAVLEKLMANRQTGR